MKISGEATLPAPVDRVWDALLDPAVLVRTIPGCERLETTGENSYAMTVTAGVAAVKGTYSGTCTLRDLHPGESLVLSAEGAGAPGTIAADVRVGFSGQPDGTTAVTYDADATVGGVIGGVGQRMLTSVSKRMAGEFFGAVDRVLTGTEPAEVAAQQQAPGQAGTASPEVAPGVFAAPATRPEAAQDDFVKGLVMGAGLVLVGVVTGVLSRRGRG